MWPDARSSRSPVNDDAYGDEQPDEPRTDNQNLMD